MAIPSYPSNLIPRPFADKGTFQIIPDAKTIEGRASWQEGFPVETQLPLAGGGIAPSRTDFNGVFNMLSALGYWQQAGGLFIYSIKQDYNTPAIIFFDNMLWFCKVPNGPNTTAGVKTPNEEPDYWMSLPDFFAAGGGGGSSYGVPVGTVISYWGVNAPDGFFALNGGSYDVAANPKLFAILGAAVLPDLRGQFIRGYDPQGTVDPDGASRTLGTAQSDAMRNLEGTIQDSGNIGFNPLTGSGPFYATALNRGKHYHPDKGGGPSGIGFDASRQVPTSTEFRPKNFNLLLCIKHD